MYENFKELNCIAENILNYESQEMNKLITERMFVPNDNGKKPIPDFTFKGNEACIEHEKNTKFCSRGRKPCNEIVNDIRNDNGNDQKLFLFSSKRKILIPPQPCYFIQTENRC
jgi:hypothetical protein